MTDIRAGSSSKITFTLKDAAGVAVPAASVVTLTLSLYNTKTDAVINSRDNQNVKGVNGGTVVDGGGTIVLGAADNPLQLSTLQSEPHTALLKFTTANEAGSGELTFNVLRVRP